MEAKRKATASLFPSCRMCAASKGEAGQMNRVDGLAEQEMIGKLPYDNGTHYVANGNK